MRMFYFSWSDFSLEVHVNCIILSFHVVFFSVYQLIQKKNYLKKMLIW